MSYIWAMTMWSTRIARQVAAVNESENFPPRSVARDIPEFKVQYLCLSGTWFLDFSPQKFSPCALRGTGCARRRTFPEPFAPSRTGS